MLLAHSISTIYMRTLMHFCTVIFVSIISEKICKNLLTAAKIAAIIISTQKIKPKNESSSADHDAFREPQVVGLRQLSPCEWTYEGGSNLTFYM